jgi:tRNA(Arg) A34 adenosine deaminase TadA
MAASSAACWTQELGFSGRQLRHFQHARAAAELSDFRVKVGAVAVLGKHVLGSGFSSYKSHPLQARMDTAREFRDNTVPSHALHAEINCLAPLINDKTIDWSRVELYVYRIRKDRPHGMARPCPACMALLKECSIRHLYYTTDDGYAYERLA